MTSPVLRPLSVGEILDVSFGIYRRHFVALAGIVLICSGVPFLLNLFMQWSGGLGAHFLLWVFTLVLSIVLSAIGTAAAVFIVSESYLGNEVGTEAALRRAVPFLGRLLVYSILSTMLIGFGIILLVVPGLILACGLIVGTPALILEGLPHGTDALSRSWNLTRGSRWKMFGLLITAFIIILAPAIALGILGDALVPGGPARVLGPTPTGRLLFAAAGGLVQMFLVPLLYCVITIAYYDLRVRKEGFDLELLAATLQPA